MIGSLEFSAQASVPTSARDRVEVSLQQSWMSVGGQEGIPLSFTARLWEVVRRDLEEIALWKAVRDVLGKRVWKHVGAKVDRRMWKRVETSVRECLQDSIQLRVEASDGSSARFGVEASVWDHVEASIRESVEASIRESVEASRWDRVWSGVWDQVWRRVRDRVLEGLPFLNGRLWNREKASVKSYEEADLLACYRFFDEYLEPNVLGALARFNELVSGYWLEHERAFIVRRPKVLARDAEGRLHSATGKCLQYPDGWGFYAWHGVVVPERVILAPASLTRADFLRERNVEVRRVMQERMGERFVSELGGRVLDTGPRGTLYEVPLEDDPQGSVRYVQVQDASTPRRYFLRVPPTVQTAAEAVAWSFGLSDGLKGEAFNDTTAQASQRAIAAHFARSWQNLSGRQQHLFAGLSLLAGASFPRAAALAVAEAAPEAGDPRDTPASPGGDLARLVAYGLVGVLAGERLRLHPLLRVYAAERLTSLPGAVQERLGEAMLAYWLSYAQTHPGYAGMGALEAEAEGLIGALAWAHDHARHRDLLTLAQGLMTAWGLRGRCDEGERMYAWAEAAAQQLGDRSWRRWAVHQGAITHWRAGRIEQARLGYERALALAKQLDDPAAEREDVHNLAMLAAETGRPLEARAGFVRALALARQLGDPAAEAQELRTLGVFIGQRGEPERGRALIREALAICEQLSDVYPGGKCHQYLAWIDAQQGNRAGAQAHYREALFRFEKVQVPDAEQVRAGLRTLGVGT